MNSVLPPPPHSANLVSQFNRSEFEVFSHHTSSAAHSGDAHGDRMLEWATNLKFKPDRIRFTKMKTMGEKAIKLIIPADVMHKDFTEPLDGCQRIIFFSGPSTTQLRNCFTPPGSKASSIPSLKRITLLNRSSYCDEAHKSVGYSESNFLPDFLS